MRSELPKVLHPVCGTPMAEHVVAAARGLYAGPDRRRRRAPGGARSCGPRRQRHRLRRPNRAAGHRRRRRPLQGVLGGCDRVVVLNGDAPLITTDLLAELLRSAEGAPLAFVTSMAREPGRLGRVTRDAEGHATAVIEAADYEGPDGAAEINAGQYAFSAEWLWGHLPRVPKSPTGEYYLPRSWLRLPRRRHAIHGLDSHRSRARMRRPRTAGGGRSTDASPPSSNATCLRA